MTPPGVLSRLKRRVASSEPIVLVVFCIASGAAFAFLRLMREMQEGETRSFDEGILRALRMPGDISVPIGPAWLTKALTDLTALGGVTVLGLLTVLAVLYLTILGKHRTGLFLLASVVGGWLISNGVKLGVARPRPDVVAHLVEVNDFSFPSGHAMLSAVTYLTMGALLSRTQERVAARYFLIITALLLTLLIGTSRVYLGVHYPTDVLGGWAAGAAWACLCWLAARLVTPNAPSEQPADSETGTSA